jgi:hypothetical protein
MQQILRIGRLFVVTLVLAVCLEAFASTQKTMQISFINFNGQPLPSLFSGWPVSARGLYILAHKNDPPLASCTPARPKMPQLQLTVWNPKDKPRLMRAQYDGGCYGSYMALLNHPCTYTSDYQQCSWQSVDPGYGPSNAGYMTTPPACPSDQTGVSPYMGNCPGYTLCDNGNGSGGGGNGDDGDGNDDGDKCCYD